VYVLDSTNQIACHMGPLGPRFTVKPNLTSMLAPRLGDTCPAYQSR